MALKLSETYKGLPAEYWRIDNINIDDQNNFARISLWLYANQESASSKQNRLKREVFMIEDLKDITIPEELSSEQNMRNLIKSLAYEQLKESNLVQDTNADGTPKVEDGNPVMIESNKFAEAIDC